MSAYKEFKEEDYCLEDPFDVEQLKLKNTRDVFLNKFDITWADIDKDDHAETGHTGVPLDAFEHKIGEKLWDKLPCEPINLVHSQCGESNIYYQFNNEYFRSENFTDKHDGKHILFAGCSETEGVGGPLEYTWTLKLYERLAEENKLSGFYSIARSGYGWQKIISNFMVYVSKYGFPDFFFVMLPNLNREYRYSIEDKSYQYYQLYPTSYGIDTNGNYNINNVQNIPAQSLYKWHTVSIEEYFKTLIDFSVSWKLFEQFCKTNNVKLLWSTYENIDAHNFLKLGMGESFFHINVERPAVKEYIMNHLDRKIKPDDFQLRDGHSGELVKQYWSDMFYNEIKKRGML